MTETDDQQVQEVFGPSRLALPGLLCKIDSPLAPRHPLELTFCLQRLKSALWFSIGKIVDEETLKLGLNATPQFIGALTELVWAQIGTCFCFPLFQWRPESVADVGEVCEYRDGQPRS